MAEITILGVLGNPAGTREGQICLAHGFGDGGEQSSMFTVEAVSRLFQGIAIDFYVTMNLDGITNFNDALGGVTVTLEDDFSALDPAMQPGETLTLRGKQAEYYVRTRMGIGEGTNEARMKRQDNYLSVVSSLIDEKTRDSANFIGNLFDSISGYLTTDMRRGRMINEAYWSRDYTRNKMITPPGEHTVGESGFMQFRADEQGLLQIVLDVFYEPAETP
jgi:LCP family protein required for cell wall assembly